MKLRGYLKFRSIEKVTEKPMIYSVGGFAATSQDGRYYCFDWEASESEARIEKERLYMYSEMRCFDDEFFNESNLSVALTEITPEFIINSILTEVSYECFKDDMEGHIPLELISFVVCSNTSDDYEFSKEQLTLINAAMMENSMED